MISTLRRLIHNPLMRVCARAIKKFQVGKTVVATSRITTSVFLLANRKKPFYKTPSRVSLLEAISK